MIQALLAEAAPLTANRVLGNYVPIFVAAFLVCLLTTPLMRWIAQRFHIVDHPDQRRKTHRQPIPYLGGLAIFLGFAAGIAWSLLIPPHSGGGGGRVNFPLAVLGGAAIITLIGLIDDVYHVPPRVKVGGQFLAAGALASQDMGLRLVAECLRVLGLDVPQRAALQFNDLIALPAGEMALSLVIYVLGMVVIAVFVVGACNAVNLIDGMDGLATGVVSIAAGGFLFIAVSVALEMSRNDPAYAGANLAVDPVRLVMCMALLGAALGFLPWNFNPASIFMGDAGSQLLGFLCISTILMFAHTATKGPMFVMAAFIVFAVPITDTFLAIVRRKLRGKPILSPDDQHLHHQLHRLMKHWGLPPGLAVKSTVLLMYLLALVFAVLGCSMVYLRWRSVLAVFLLIFGFIIVTTIKVGTRQARDQTRVNGTPGHAAPRGRRE